MTDQERQLIQGLVDKIRNAPSPQIDRDADALIRSGIGSRPDALYILTQTVLIQDMALKQAQAQIDALRQQAPPANFLPQQGYAQPPQGYQQGYAQSPYADAPPPQRHGFSDFLHNAATTAAGVIAGEIAFDSLASIFGGRGGGFMGGGGGFFGGGGVMPGGETIVNNYYEDRPGGSGGDSGSRFADAADRSDDNVSPDIEDDRDNSGDNFSGDDNSGGDFSGDDGSGSSDV